VTFDSLIFLLANYWTYMAGVLVIGLVAGWLSYAPRKR
jgi:hypothetical protein